MNRLQTNKHYNNKITLYIKGDIKMNMKTVKQWIDQLKNEGLIYVRTLSNKHSDFLFDDIMHELEKQKINIKSETIDGKTFIMKLS